MKNIKHIINKGRDKIDFWDLFPIFIHLFSIMGLFFAIIFITESLLIKYLVICLSYIILTLITYLHLKNLLYRTSYIRYVNHSKRTLESIIAEISIDFSIKVHKKEENIYTMSYFLSSNYNIFKKKKEVTIITIDDTILLNIALTNKAELLKVRDDIAIKLIEAIDLKTRSNEFKNNYKIVNPFKKHNYN